MTYTLILMFSMGHRYSFLELPEQYGTPSECMRVSEKMWNAYRSEGGNVVAAVCWPTKEIRLANSAGESRG